MVIYPLVLILVMIFRTEGIMGLKEFGFILMPTASEKGGECIMALLEIQHLTQFFGGLRAVSDFNIQLEHGEIVGLIGPNGAGKTTVFNVLTGVYAPTKGTIVFNGANIAGRKTHVITQAGIATDLPDHPPVHQIQCHRQHQDRLSLPYVVCR